jgi:hypothetical protein
MGVGPTSMEDGDKVVLLFGLCVPLVVRPKFHLGLQQYAVVGECFVPDIMNGVIVEKLKTLASGKRCFALSNELIGAKSTSPTPRILI